MDMEMAQKVDVGRGQFSEHLSLVVPERGESHREEAQLSVDQFCAKIAERFQVRVTDIGLLRIEGMLLRFVWPSELAKVASIPLNSRAVAARTATSKRAEMFNNFVAISHWSFFETVRLRNSTEQNSQVIQKLMSAPVLDADGQVLGVLQVSRKGLTPEAAGPDFRISDLLALKVAAAELVTTMPGLQAASVEPGYKLSFHNHHGTR